MKAPYPTYTPRPITQSDVEIHDAHGDTPSSKCRLCRAIRNLIATSEYTDSNAIAFELAKSLIGITIEESQLDEATEILEAEINRVRNA